MCLSKYAALKLLFFEECFPRYHNQLKTCEFTLPKAIYLYLIFSILSNTISIFPLNSRINTEKPGSRFQVVCNAFTQTNKEIAN